MSAALITKGLQKRFGGIVATHDVDFTLERGARHALIGPNGAGKTTFVNLLTGMIAPSAGQIWLDGVEITRMSPEARVKRGLVRTFQINQLFSGMTPFESLGAAISERLGRGADWWRPAGSRANIRHEIEEIATRFRLQDVLDAPVQSMPYGKQRLLEIALAFACHPHVLLLDEPAAGVPEAERHEILATISALPRDVSIVLIEHDMDLVFAFAEVMTVLVNGAVLTAGSVAQISSDPRVRAVYLGGNADG